MRHNDIITDIRDLFQSNPFNPFKKNAFLKWPQANFMMIFKEAFPNIMIYDVVLIVVGLGLVLVKMR